MNKLFVLALFCCQLFKSSESVSDLIENFVRDSQDKLIGTPVIQTDEELNGAQLVNNNSPPKIIFENQYGSYHVSVKCLGEGVTSLSAIQCDSPVECNKQISCFDQNSLNKTSCPKGKLIYRGEKCPSIKGQEGTNCFELEDRRWQLTSGLIECTTISPDQAHSQRTIQQFFKGTDQFFHLVQANEFQMNLDVSEKIHEPIIYMEYVGRPVFYTNKKVNIHCRATKFLFKSVSILGLKADGSNFQIDANSSLPGDEDKYWEKFYWEAYKPSMSLTTDLIGFTCTAQRYDSTEWSETTFQLTTTDPTKPVIDKSKTNKKIIWSANENQHEVIACNYTGGPADVEIIRESDGKNVADRVIRSYGLIRESRNILQRFNYEQQGNYTCRVTNALGNDSFQFYVDITRSHASSIGWSLTLFVVPFLLVMGNGV